VFIKWRTYQGKLNGIEGDNYIQQPIIVKSFSVRKKGFLRELAKKKDEYILSCVHHEKVVSPRHEAIEKFPSYPICMVIYFHPSEYMKQRHQWWERVDSLFARMVEKWPDTMNEETVKKLRADIEKTVQRMTESEEIRISQVLNDLPPNL